MTTQDLLIGTQSIAAAQLLPLLASYQMLPQLRRELIIDQAIASITCRPDEATQAQQQFFQQNQIKSDADLSRWMEHYGVNHRQLPDIMARPLRIEKFKHLTWGAKLDGHFLTRKAQFDKVLYSLVRVKERGAAQELYFRLQAGEQSFTELAREHSQGPEAQTGGLVGPFELSTLQPNLAQILAASQPGQISQPVYLNEWFVVVRLEKLIAARLDEPMRQRLLNDLFKEWLQQQMEIQLEIQRQTPVQVQTPNSQDLATLPM